MELTYQWNKPKANSHPIDIHDESLRDGIQSNSINAPLVDQKLELIQCMGEIGVNSIDIGMPIVGPKHAEEVFEIAKAVAASDHQFRMNCAARTMAEDIFKIAEISQRAGVPIGVDLFVGCSSIRQFVEGWDLDHLKRLTEESISLSLKENLEVMYVTEDTTRTDPHTIKELYTLAINSGAERICIADTVGSITPFGTRQLVSYVRQMADAITPNIQIDWHGHNDRLLSIANSMAAIEAGANQIHGTILGIGERCGNTPIEILMVNLDCEGYLADNTNIKALKKYIDLAVDYFEITLEPNHPFFGENAFKTSAGIHAAAIIKAIEKGEMEIAELVYSPIEPQKINRKQIIEIGPMSGRHNVIFWLKNNHIEYNQALADHILLVAKQQRRILFDAEIGELITKYKATVCQNNM